MNVFKQTSLIVNLLQLIKMVLPDVKSANLVIRFKVLLESVLRNVLGIKAFNQEHNFASFVEMMSLSIPQQVNASLVIASFTIQCATQENSILIKMSSNLDVFQPQIAQSIMELCQMDNALFALQTVL